MRVCLFTCMCVHIYADILLHVCAHVCGCLRLVSDVSLNDSSLSILRIEVGSLWNQRLPIPQSSQPVSSGLPSLGLLWTEITGRLQHPPGVYMDTRDPTSRPHASAASVCWLSHHSALKDTVLGETLRPCSPSFLTFL